MRSWLENGMSNAQGVFKLSMRSKVMINSSQKCAIRRGPKLLMAKWILHTFQPIIILDLKWLLKCFSVCALLLECPFLEHYCHMEHGALFIVGLGLTEVFVIYRFRTKI
jgi:hypothetical protein